MRTSSLFPLVVLKCILVLKKKQSGKSEKLLCLIGVDRTRRGLAGLKYIFLTVEGTRVRRHALEGEFLM